MSFIHVNKEGTGFCDTKTQKPYTPFGCNYFDPLTGWAPHIWQLFDAGRVQAHFMQMKELGVNTVRVFLSITSFMTESGELSASGIEKCDELINIANQYNIKVEFSGPSNWEGYPDWAQKYFTGEPNAYFINAEWIERLERFWTLFAARYREESAIFSYDLLNEPALEWDSPLIRELWGRTPPEEKGIHSDQWIDFQKFRVHLTREWVGKMVKAIHASDTNHMITFGFHQDSLPDDPSVCFTQPGFSVEELSDFFEYIGYHWYPFKEGEHIQPHQSVEELSHNIKLIRASLQRVDLGKPFVLEEFGWYGGDSVVSWEKQLPFVSEEMQAQWCSMVIESTRDLCAGWLTWGYSDVPSSQDISKKSGLVDEHGRVKRWGEVFRGLQAEGI